MRMKNNEKYKGYDKDFLILELKRFYKQNNKIPTSGELEATGADFPSRKTYEKYFGSFRNALREAGFDIKDKPDLSNREYLLSEINRYILEFGKQPFSREMDLAKGYPSKNNYSKIFGSWNNAIKELGLRVRVSQYSEIELDEAFFSFVNTHGRPPKLHEFNDASKHPSFWCYQNRFGSWNKTLIHYGFEPNEGTSGKWSQFENGEICKSTYEYDISKWLRSNNISYLRNIPYRDFIDDYDGKKDCDYVIILHGEWIWLEIAGLYSNREKKSSLEKHYIKAFEHKMENLLCNFNFQVFYPEDFTNYTIDELFDFLWEIPECPWGDNEPIYRGIPEEIEEVLEWLNSEEKSTIEFMMN